MLNRLYIASKGLAKFATAKRNHIAGESLLRKLHLISANVFRQPDWRRDLKPSWIKIGAKSDLCLQVSNGIIVAQVKPDDYDDDECEHSIKYVTDLSTMQPMEGIARTKWSRHTAMAVANAYSEYSFRKRFNLDTRVPLRNPYNGEPIYDGRLFHPELLMASYQPPTGEDGAVEQQPPTE